MEERIKYLESLIRKRDELIYSMIRSTTYYQTFIMKEDIGIDELRDKYKTESQVSSNVAKYRIGLLGKDVNC